MNRKHRLFLPVLLSGILINTVFADEKLKDTAFVQATIKLYSGGKIVGEWQSHELGQAEGNCYVFRVRKGATDPQVRVCGTYSVEYKF